MNLTQLIILLIFTIFLNFLWGSLYKSKNDSKALESTHEIDSSIVSNAPTKGSKKVIKYFFLGIALFPLIGGIWAINYWLRDYNTANDSINWKAFNGRMIEKSISQCSNAGTTGHQLAGRTYSPSVKYEFTYNNKTITWHKINYLNTPCSGDKTKSQEILDSLPGINKELTVYFSPEKKQAVLIPGTKNSSYFGILGGLFFYLIGLLGIKLIY